jgi:hypothetical protein
MSMESNSSKIVYRFSDSAESRKDSNTQQDGPMRMDFAHGLIVARSLATPRRSSIDTAEEHYKRPCRAPLSARAVLQTAAGSHHRDTRDRNQCQGSLEGVRPGQESARCGQESARAGQESARPGLSLGHDEGCKIPASVHIKFGIILGVATQPANRGPDQVTQTRHQQQKPAITPIAPVAPVFASMQPPVSRGLLHRLTPRGRDTVSRAGSGMQNADEGMKKGTLIGLIADKRANGEKGKVSLRSFSFKERQA